MRRSTVVLCLALIGACLTPAAGYSTRATSNLCVGGTTGCFSTIQAAVDAAHDGDTIRIAPGTFAGGITIDVSVDIRGAGAGATTIKGGGPVLTIGKEFASSEPTVSISGVTVTGGVNNSVPDHAVTQGGGIRIPQAGSFPFKTGATVAITDSVITGNKVASQQLLPPGLCPAPDCSFASGGGINNDGDLTLINTRVTNNQAGDPDSVTVVATAGGISNSQRGKLTLRHSFVSGNRAVATPPYGAAADGGGIVTRGPVTIEDSVLRDNSAELSSTIATNELGPAAIAGALHVTDGGSATVVRSILSGNRVTASGTGDLVVGVAGAIDDDGSLVLSDSTVAHNETSATAPASQATAIVGGAMDIDGVATIRDSRFVGNSGNGSAPAGTVFAGGGAIANFGQTTLERTVVAANSLSAAGSAGLAQGGGIGEFSFGGPPPSLALTDSVVTANRVSGSAGITVQGGGLFTTFPVTLTRTVIAGNKPDQCFGC